LQRLVEQGHVSAAIGRSMCSTFLASMFRSLRFGINEAHGRGVAIQLNHFLDSEAVHVDSGGRFEIIGGAIQRAVTALTAEIMTIQAEGSYRKARSIIERLGVIRPEVQRVLDRLDRIPVDIEPQFVTADEIARQVPA
jgi:hypothetical protein